jgi:hypothetical protein
MSADEIAVARANPRLKPRDRVSPGLPDKTLSERQVSGALCLKQIEFEHETIFFPTKVHWVEVGNICIPDPNIGTDWGFCPDIRLPATPDYPEQYWEITEATPDNQTKKRAKIYNAIQIHGIIVRLITKPDATRIHLNPDSLWDYIQTYSALAP